MAESWAWLEGFSAPNDEAWGALFGKHANSAAGVAFCQVWWMYRKFLQSAPPTNKILIFRAPLLTKPYTKDERAFVKGDLSTFLDRGQRWWIRCLDGNLPTWLNRWVVKRCPRIQDVAGEWAPCAPCDWAVRAQIPVEKVKTLLEKHDYSEEEPLLFIKTSEE